MTKVKFWCKIPRNLLPNVLVTLIQHLVWTNDGQVYWRVYASLSLDESERQWTHTVCDSVFIGFPSLQMLSCYLVSAYLFCNDYDIIHFRGGISLDRWRLTSIGIPMLKIRSSHDGLIFNVEIPIPGKDSLYIKTGPWIRAMFLSIIFGIDSRQLTHLTNPTMH